MHEQTMAGGGLNIKRPDVEEDRVASMAREQASAHAEESRHALQVAQAQREALVDALRAVDTRIDALRAAVSVYDQPTNSRD